MKDSVSECRQHPVRVTEQGYSGKCIQRISLILILLINSIWVIRYSHRISPTLPIPLTIVYIASSISVMILIEKVKWLRSNAMLLVAMVCYSIISFIIISHTDLSDISLDRSRIIASFWNSAFSGHQPYSLPADNGNYPGPLPFYFVIMLPIYIFKIYWLPSYISGLIMFWLYFKRTDGMSRQSMALFFISPFLYYEILTGSTILFNSVLMLLWYLWIKDKYMDTAKDIWITAIVTGLLLCVRQVFAIAITVYVMKNIRYMRFWKIAGWTGIVLIVWCLCFLPIILEYGIDSFIAYNPFNVQNDFIFPFKYSVIFLVIVAIWGFFSTSNQSVAFCMGVSLISIPATIIINCLMEGQSLFNTYADITYTLFGTTFLFYLIHNNSFLKNDKREKSCSCTSCI